MDWKRVARHVLNTWRRSIERMRHHPRTRDELHRYWYAPPDRGNMPESYLAEGENRKSEFLVGLVKPYVKSEAKIMEIGCNAGRNLTFLYRAGFRELSAIEISKPALDMFRDVSPDIARDVTVRNAPVEDAIRECPTDSIDLLFTMAVLEHIHPDSEWVFREMARVTGQWIITIEDEVGVSERHFPRNYKRVFEKLGMKQVQEVAKMDIHGLPEGFVARVFRKPR